MQVWLRVFLMSHEAVLLKQGSDFHTELTKPYRLLFAGTQPAVGYEFFVMKGMKKSLLCHPSLALDWKN